MPYMARFDKEKGAQVVAYSPPPTQPQRGASGGLFATPYPTSKGRKWWLIRHPLPNLKGAQVVAYSPSPTIQKACQVCEKRRLYCNYE
jgi:hypothetical protein